LHAHEFILEFSLHVLVLARNLPASYVPLEHDEIARIVSVDKFLVGKFAFGRFGDAAARVK
jgi:hypothetical protein